MKTIQVSQTSETEVWLAARRGLSTGTKSGDIALEHYKQIDVGHIREMGESAKRTAESKDEMLQKDLAKVTELEAKQETLSQELDDLNAQFSQFTARTEDAKTHLKKVKTETTIKKWQTDLDTSKKMIEKLNKSVERKEGELSKVANDIAKAEEKADTHKKDKESYLAKAADYEDKAAQAERENERLKSTAGYWQFMAENMAEEPTAENPIDRGHRLENDNARLTCEDLGISDDDVNYDPGIWQSDIDVRIACSPDAHENAIEPSWAIECKSLGSANHLMYVVPILLHRMIISGEYGKEKLNDAEVAAHLLLTDIVGHEDTRDFDFVPDKYKTQVLQYFVVNDNLKTLYFSFYDDRVYMQAAQHVVLTVTRDSIESEIKDHMDRQLVAIQEMDRIGECISALSDQEPMY